MEEAPVSKNITPPKTFLIPIVGGPCSGKSEGTPVLKTSLGSFGYPTIGTEESASFIFRQLGIQPQNHLASRQKVKTRQRCILLQTMLNEDNLSAMVEGNNTVILCDRGAPDIRVFFPDGYQEVLGELGIPEEKLLSRYHGVIHLVTAADGAPQFYKCDNVRDESIAQALAQDALVYEAYRNHPNYFRIDNSTDFQTKLERAFHAILHILNPPKEIERKFRVSAPLEIPSIAISRRIEQTYLKSPKGQEWRVRKSTDLAGQSEYTFTRKIDICKGKRYEKDEKISLARYNELLGQKDTSRLTIHKLRHSFPHEGRMLELDQYEGHLKGLWILEAELKNLDEPFSIPEWISAEKEVTGDKRYSNFNLALERSAAIVNDIIEAPVALM